MVLPVRSGAIPRPLRILGQIEGLVAGFLLMCVLGLVIYQVVTRYVLRAPAPWTEELARFALIWLAFIGAGWVAYRGSHVTVRLFDHRYKPRARALMDALAGVITLIIAGSLIIGAPAFLITSMRTASPALSVPMGWVYGAAVVGYALIVLHTVSAIVIVLLRPDALRQSLGVDAEIGAEDDQGAAK